MPVLTERATFLLGDTRSKRCACVWDTMMIAPNNTNLFFIESAFFIIAMKIQLILLAIAVHSSLFTSTRMTDRQIETSGIYFEMQPYCKAEEIYLSLKHR